MSALDLDVATLNVWGLPWPLARHRGRRFERIRRQLEQHRRDLVGLQELWGGSHRRLAVAELARPASRRDSGLALAGALARASEVDLRHFRSSRGPDRLKAKGFLIADVPLEPLGLSLRVIVTHLQAGRRHAAVRAGQIDELLAVATRGDAPTVLMGDFNLFAGVRDDRRSVERLAAAGFADVASPGAAVPTFEPASNPYAPRWHGAERFDRILVRDGRDAGIATVDSGALVAERPLSDHHGVWARLRIAGRHAR